MILDDNNIFTETRSIIIPLFGVRKKRDRPCGRGGGWRLAVMVVCF